MERTAKKSAILSAILVAASVPFAGACKPTTTAPAAAEAGTTPTATTPPAGGSAAAGGTAPAAVAPSPPATASPADPQDATLAAFARDVAQAVVHAARGEPVDPRWVAHDAAHSVTVLTDEARRGLTVVGNAPTMVIAELEVDGVAQPAPGQHHQVMTHIILLPDNTIRWGTVASRQDESSLVEPTPGLATSAPALVAGLTRAMTALAGNCTLPWVAESDLTAVPARIRGEFVTDMTATHAGCTQVAGVHGEWRPHADDVRVLVSGNGHHAFVNSVFDVEGAAGPAANARVVLSQIHIEPVPET